MACGPRLGLIAYEYPPLIGGMATYARALAEHMHAAGYDVHVFANQEAAPDERFHVHALLTTDLARDLRELVRHDMDLWHAINFGYAPLALCRRPFVLTVHGTDFLRPWVRFTMDRLPLLWRASGLLNKRPIRRAVYGAALRCVDQVLTCSSFSADRFLAEYRFPRSVRIIPNGVDAFFLEPTVSVSRHPRRILSVANLDTANLRKNIDGVIRAVGMVGKQLDLEYRIIGDGAGRPALEQLAKELGVSNRVCFDGRVSRDSLRDAYASSQLFVMAPRPLPDDVEGFGIVYLEAAGQGTPSLASRCGGALDALGIRGDADTGSAGFVVDPSAESIAAGLSRFFSGRIHFDENTVRAHANGFAWPSVLQQVETVYRRVLRQKMPSDNPATAALTHTPG